VVIRVVKVESFGNCRSSSAQTEDKPEPRTKMTKIKAIEVSHLVFIRLLLLV
jgi:hypothetical protein